MWDEGTKRSTQFRVRCVQWANQLARLAKQLESFVVRPKERGVVCVFARSRRSDGLVSALGAAEAAALTSAFFRDTWQMVCSLPWAKPVAATSGRLAADLDPPAATVWRQGGGDLGKRLERILRQALRGADFVIAVSADHPALPARLLEAARLELQGADAVLGPSEDGGFYLLGLKRCPTRLLAGLPWNQREMFAHTLARLREHGLMTRVLEPRIGMDGVESLERLDVLLSSHEVRAPETQRVLAEIRRAPTVR